MQSSHGLLAEGLTFLSASQTILLNYRLFQKFKLLENGKFNHLTMILTLPLTYEPKLPINKWGPNNWEFNILNKEVK